MMTIKRCYIVLTMLISGLSAVIAQEVSSIQLLRSRTQTNYIWVAAHRGDWKYAPENSLQGLRNALFFGADIIETDVRPTQDGHFIVMHDAMNVRYETGKQSKVLNELIEKFNMISDHDVTLEKKLEEFVGHTPIQVAAGFVLGVVVALIVNR